MKSVSTGLRERTDRLAAAEQLRDGLPALVAVVLGQLVDVHLDEPVGDRDVDAAAELERVLECLLPVVETALDRVAQDVREIVQPLLSDVPAGDVDTERQRQTGLQEPPLTQVEELDETEVRERQLALVDQETRRRRGPRRPRTGSARTAARGRGKSPSARRSTRNAVVSAPGTATSVAPTSSSDIVAAPDEHGPVARADARPVRQQRVVLLHERVRGERQRRHLQAPCARPLVERLDVSQHLLEDEPPRVDQVRGQGPVHECVVRVRAVSHTDAHGRRTLATCARDATGEPPRQRVVYARPVAKTTLSDSIQDYLRHILVLGAEGERVSTTALARSQGVAPASATSMVKKLAALGLVEHAPYRGVSLTEDGARVAIEVTRHHRLLELYLAETLGIDVEHVHAEADRLEHVISEELEARIDQALGYPTHDPHGDPIPDADLNWPKPAA